MLHPYKEYHEDTEIDDMEQITVTLEICTLYKGLPHGIAVITFADPNDKWDSFRSVGVFNHGILHNAPFTCVTGDGAAYLLTKMLNGRSAHASYFTYFLQNGST